VKEKQPSPAAAPNAATARAQEWAQPALVLAAAVFAWWLPVDGLFLSFTFLGPLHFLTQISWLHDRSYFFRDAGAKSLFLPAAAIGTLWYSFLSAGAPWSAFVALTLFLSPLFLRASAAARLWLPLGALIALALSRWPGAALTGGYLLPTVVHVGLFTLCFMLQGALRRGAGGVPAALATGLWALCAAVLLLAPGFHGLDPGVFRSAHLFWDPLVKDKIGPLLPVGFRAIYGFLTFAYTYHFLNWFSKTEILKWHLMPAPRRLWVGAAYAGIIATCLYNYMAGYLLLLLPLSVLHVFLEFPLDGQVLLALPRAAAARFRPEGRSGP
jgi:hypothetical protein